MNSDTILQILAITTAVVMALHGAIPALRALAEKSASKRDDDAVNKLEVAINYAIQALDIVRRFLPRVVIGPLPSTQPIARSLPPRSGRTLPGPAPVPTTLGVAPMKPISVPPPRGRDES